MKKNRLLLGLDIVLGIITCVSAAAQLMKKGKGDIIESAAKADVKTEEEND